MFFNTTDLNTIGDKIVAYFPGGKICRADGATTGCFADTIKMNYDGTSTESGYDDPGAYRFTTKDGTGYWLYEPVKDCDLSNRGVADGLAGKLCMSYLYVDVNGLKPPNTAGRDVFEFMISNGRGPAVYLSGGELSMPSWKNNGVCIDTNRVGLYCAGRILEEGWKMNY